ncbi:MAG: RDD family protein [Campylobacterota bacterium]|nr:RDD family protein [Campylobacterota bacterium]
MSEENFALNQEYIAPPKKRAGAFIIDDLVISFLFMAIFWSQISELHTVESINLFLTENFLTIVLIKILYHTFFVWQSGMTLGKHFLKIKVVTMSRGETPPLHTAFLRALLRIASETFFYLGFIMAFFNPMVQTFHDKFSGCVVVDA